MYAYVCAHIYVYTYIHSGHVFVDKELFENFLVFIEYRYTLHTFNKENWKKFEYRKFIWVGDLA